MILTYKFKIDFNEQISQFCQISKNLYNQGNYLIRQEFINNKKWLRYNDLNKIIKNFEEKYNNYYLLKSQTNQQILMLLDRNWKSFFKSIKDYMKNKFKYSGKPNLPKYLKEKEYLLIYTNQNCQIKNNKLILSKTLFINIPFYKNKDFSNFQQVRILPRKNYYEVEIIYNQKIKNEDLDYNNYLSIDLGLDNLCTCVSENKCFIISGKIIKSINQYFNKFYSKLKSIKDKKCYKSNINKNKLLKLEEERKNLLKDNFHKISRFLINYCIKNKIGKLIIGYNKQWKDSIEIGKRNNQNFVQIPYRQLISYLTYKCELVGIELILNEESYTSKCDSLALEQIQKHEIYSGKRIKRGLFQSSISKLINADINGAINILRKVIGDSNEFIQKIINSRVLFNPIKIRSIVQLANFCKGGIK
jgi:putative transposase